MKIIQRKLDNGIPVVLIPMKGVKDFAQICAVRGGSMYETEGTSGVSHMLEHVLFKGTRKRPTAKEIAIELDSVAGDYNAFTSRESIAFYATSLPKHFERITDILSDQVVNSVLNTREIEKEKGAVLQELRGSESEPSDKVMEILSMLVYGNQAAGRSILGTEGTIKSFTRKQIRAQMNRYFNNRNMFIAVAGRIPDEQRVIDVLNDHYNAVRDGTVPRQYAVRDTNQEEPGVVVSRQDIPQTYMSLAVRSPSRLSEKWPALSLLNVIMGYGMSSRLFSEVRENRGMAYYIGSSTSLFANAGNWIIQAGVDRERIYEALTVIRDELANLAQVPVSEEELQKAKDMLELAVQTSGSSSSSVAHRAVHDMIKFGRVRDDEKDIIKPALSVTSQDVLELAADMFVSKNLNLAVVGPHSAQDREEFAEAISF